MRLLPDIRLRSPANQEFIPAVDLGSVVVINISLPVLGWWNLEVNSPLPYSVRVKGVSLVDFKIHFTVASGTERVFITRPVEGRYLYWYAIREMAAQPLSWLCSFMHHTHTAC